jgi:RNA polymerase sigma-70 factor, ECF subfamily
MNGMSETDLIERAKRGESQACRALYNRYAPRVYAVVRRLAGDDGLADDWAQEAWVRVFRALPGFRGDSAFSTWLHRVAVNSALQGQRKRKRHASREAPLTESLAAAPRPDRPVLRMQLERALQALPDGMRQVLVLHDVEGYTHEEIGDMLGVAEGTSKSQLFKARAKMRELLRPAPDMMRGGEVCI